MPIPDQTKSRSYNGDYMREGKEGESYVYDFLKSRSNVKNIDDLRDDPEWQQRDVDFRVRRHDASELLVDAKSDVHMGISPNVLFELLRINHTSDDFPVRYGWSVASGAALFCIWSPPLMRLYRVWADDLRSAMRRYTDHARKNTRIDIVPTDRIKTTVNILIPRAYVSYIAFDYNGGRWPLAEKKDAEK